MSKSQDVLKGVKVELKKAIFNLDDLYKHAKEFLESRKYDVIEKEYKEKVTPQGREIKIKWESAKEIDEYSKFEIKLTWECKFINDVKVKQGDSDVDRN